MEWINQAQDNEYRRAVVNTVMEFEAPQMSGIRCLAKQISASQEGLCCMQLNISVQTKHDNVNTTAINQTNAQLFILAQDNGVTVYMGRGGKVAVILKI